MPNEEDHPGSTSVVPGGGVDPENFFNASGGRGNRKPLRYGTTGRFISPAQPGNDASELSSRSPITGRFIARNNASVKPILFHLDRTVHATGTNSKIRSTVESVVNMCKAAGIQGVTLTLRLKHEHRSL
jgi:hypothetical protein